MLNSSRAISFVYFILFAALAGTFILKPTIDNDFHAAYQRNLEALEAQAGILQREQRNVQLGITRHYDFLEATMQTMEKAAGLVTYRPTFVSKAFHTLADAEIEAYRVRLQEIRTEVEATKRLTGLLQNSRRSIDLLLAQIAVELGVDGDVPAGLFELQRHLHDDGMDEIDVAWVEKSAHAPQLKMHVDVVARLAPLSSSVTGGLQTLLESASEPARIRAAYLDEYYAAVNATQTSLLASYGIAGLLLLLSLFQVRQARQARVESERARAESEALRIESEQARADTEAQRAAADAARLESEQMACKVETQLAETRAAVAACNEVLQAVARGESGRRVTAAFAGDLGELCHGVNVAATCVEETLAEIERVMHAIRDGRLDVRANDSMRGQVAAAVAEAMQFLDHTFDGIRRAIEKMAQGEFSARVEVDARGDLAQLKDAINASMAALQDAIASINEVTTAQSNGVLTRRIERNFPGDLGVLANSVNRSAGMLREMINEVNGVAVAVAAAATHVNESAGSVTDAARDQQGVLRSTLEGSDAVSARIQRSADALDTAGRLAGDAKQRAGEGEVVLAKAQKSMESIIESSRKIENIVGVIESIAFQTNLLALNAAVEAARASEHGRGFAVVAGEVRNLAQQSAEASSSIKKLIQASVDEVQRGAKDVDATGEAFESISAVVEQVNEIFAAMKHSSAEQESSIQQVTGHVHDLDRLSRHNLALAEDNNRSAAELAEGAARMRAVLARFDIGDGMLPERVVRGQHGGHHLTRVPSRTAAA